MAIPVIDGFIITSALPADVKMLREFTASLFTPSDIDYIPSSFRYQGMEVYCQDASSSYKLIGGILDSNWIKITSGSYYINTISASYGLSSSYSLSSSNSKTASYSLSSSYSDNSTSASYIPSSGVIGLDLSRISTGSVTASVNVGNNIFNITNNNTSSFFISSSGNIGIHVANTYVNGDLLEYTVYQHVINERQSLSQALRPSADNI